MQKTDNCRKGKSECLSQSTDGNNNGTTNNPSLALNFAGLYDDKIFLAETNKNVKNSFDNELGSLVTDETTICIPCNTDEEDLGIKALN